ncbi:MAG TPA: hypothetical protein VIG80_03140, partial [Bacillaceae bacterium]
MSYVEGGTQLRTLSRVLFILAIILIISIYYYSAPDYTGPLKNNHYNVQPKMDDQPEMPTGQMNDSSVRPENGLATFIG